MDSVRAILSDHPFAGVGTSIGGYILSLSEFLSPLFRFCILVFSTITALSVAYVQFKKARSVWNGKDENPGKESDSNS